MVGFHIPTVLSVIAVLLSGIAIRRQRIITPYEARRRIKERFQQKEPSLIFTIGDIQYDITDISVNRKSRVRDYLLELWRGDVQAITEISVTINTCGAGDLTEIGGISTITGDGKFLAVVIELEVTDPDEVFEEVSHLMYQEMPEKL